MELQTNAEEDKWKQTIFTAKFASLWYEPGSWREVWKHVKDVWRRKRGHAVTVSLRHTSEVQGAVEIADLAVWAKQLTAEEIQTIRTLTTTGQPPRAMKDLRAWWSLGGESNHAESEGVE